MNSPVSAYRAIQPTTNPWGPPAVPAVPRHLPRSGEVAVWLLHLPSAAEAAAERDGVLDAEEVRRVARFRDPLHRERYVTAHVGLRVLLGGYLDADPAEIEFTRELCGMPDCDKPHGRPALRGHQGLHFSLSHAEDAALIAVADTTVGADIESRNTQRGGFDLTRKLHPDEQAAIAALPAELREEAFLSCWVRKEAYLKGIGTGLPGGLASNHVGLAEGLAPDGSYVPEGWSLIDVDAPEGYQAAVAVRAGSDGRPAAGGASGRPEQPIVSLDHLLLG
ncbi:4'-phosphopantetheinyl transferase family protein [Streptomyces palmae]|uniref:4'-phosphopantetheinyl transferase family protein n=1 Tax=Streptomyces palmae TaxID=1701085 RepID=UPI001FD865E4|nr:4'-phosphopantetheinyl transferase superfamily protein [Streptomyces palmae]